MYQTFISSFYIYYFFPFLFCFVCFSCIVGNFLCVWWDRKESRLYIFIYRERSLENIWKCACCWIYRSIVHDRFFLFVSSFLGFFFVVVVVVVCTRIDHCNTHLTSIRDVYYVLEMNLHTAQQYERKNLFSFFEQDLDEERREDRDFWIEFPFFYSNIAPFLF